MRLCQHLKTKFLRTLISEITGWKGISRNMFRRLLALLVFSNDTLSSISLKQRCGLKKSTLIEMERMSKSFNSERLSALHSQTQMKKRRWEAISSHALICFHFILRCRVKQFVCMLQVRTNGTCGWLDLIILCSLPNKCNKLSIKMKSKGKQKTRNKCRFWKGRIVKGDKLINWKEAYRLKTKNKITN